MIASPMTSSPVFDVPSTVSQWMTAGTRLWTDFSMMPGETLVSTSFFRARSGRRAFRRPMSGLGGGLESRHLGLQASATLFDRLVLLADEDVLELGQHDLELLGVSRRVGRVRLGVADEGPERVEDDLLREFLAVAVARDQLGQERLAGDGVLEVLEGLPGLAVVGREAGSLEGQTADELDLVLVGDLRLTLLGGVLGLGGLRGEAGDRLHERDRVEGEVERGLVGLALEVAVLDDTRVDRGLVSELRHCWVPVLCGCCREKTKT